MSRVIFFIEKLPLWRSVFSANSADKLLPYLISGVDFRFKRQTSFSIYPASLLFPKEKSHWPEHIEVHATLEYLAMF